MPRRRPAADRRRRARRASARSSTPASRASPTTTSPCSATAQFLAQLEAGIAAHHAGMVPAFKEVVEACFVEGLIKVVFATETLAVGINMPARTVVIEKLTKFTGDHHEMLTPGEYTQLTGRAGRRGIDDEGHAVVLWSPFVPFEQVAALAASRTFHLRSAFRPTYNMAANLVGTYTSDAGPPPAQPVVRPVPGRPRRRAPRGPAGAGARQPGRRRGQQAESPYGDIWDYRRSLDEVRARRRGRDDLVAVGLARLRPGEVVHAVEGPLPRAGRRRRQRPPQGRDAPDDGHQAGRPAAAHRRRLRRRAACRRHGPPADGVQPEPRRVPPRGRPGARQRQAARPAERPAGRRRVADGAHPVESDPDLRQRMRAAGQTERLERELVELAGRVDGPQPVAGPRVRPRARRARPARLRRRRRRGR